MTYYVSSGTLNPTHSLTHSYWLLIMLETDQCEFCLSLLEMFSILLGLSPSTDLHIKQAISFIVSSCGHWFDVFPDWFDVFPDSILPRRP